MQLHTCSVQLSNTDYLSDEFSQPCIAHQQPASGGDAVGLVLELFGLQLTEVTEPALGQKGIKYCQEPLRFSKPATWINRGFSISLHLVLDDLGVDLCHSVDCVRANNTQVRHVDPLHTLLLDDRHPAQSVHVFWEQSRDFLQENTKQTFLSLKGAPKCLLVIL